MRLLYKIIQAQGNLVVCMEDSSKLQRLVDKIFYVYIFKYIYKEDRSCLLNKVNN